MEKEKREQKLRRSLGGMTMVAINMADPDILELLKEQIDYLIENARSKEKEV